MKLSIIIPFRASLDRPYLMERLVSVVGNYEQSDNIEYILVDSGSDTTLSNEIENICNNLNIRYAFLDTRKEIFAIGNARDYGVQIAKGEYITFLDVDLVPVPSFPKKLLEYADIHIGEQKKEFFTIPCLYLTPDGSEEFISMENKNRHAIFFDSYLSGRNNLVQNLALSSSVMVLRKSHYLSVGGHRAEFKGHGYEDFELIHRLLALSGTIPRSNNYYRDSKTWDNTIFDGFRANFSLLGKGSLYFGLYVCHLWHPRPPSNGYETSRFVNHTNALDMFKKFDNDGINPIALQDLTIPQKNKTLFLGIPFSNAAECWRDAAPYLGELIYVSEYDFSDTVEVVEISKNLQFTNKKLISSLNLHIIPFEKKRLKVFNGDKFQKFVKYQNITKILFPNPYGNEVRLDMYKWAKENELSFYCFERGALPDSWFFDANGFNADSSTYNATVWDKPLEKFQKNEVQKYIHSILNSGATLEEQGNKIGGEALKERLKIGGKKVLFVPFQRPSDTVIKYFSGDIKSVENFAKNIDIIAERLKEYGWIVLCKKHPLEVETQFLQYAKWVDADSNFYDLIEMSDAVALINSGVGISSMMMNKPTYIFGKAFYYHPDINKQIKNIDDAVNQILAGYNVNQSKVEAFIYHLIKNVYSFGQVKTAKRKEKDGTFRTLTTAIDFYQLILPGIKSFEYKKAIKYTVSLKAPLLKEFHNDIYRRGKPVAKPVAKPVVKPVSDFQRKYRKFKRNPKQFFLDSNITILKFIGKRI